MKEIQVYYLHDHNCKCGCGGKNFKPPQVILNPYYFEKYLLNIKKITLSK